MLPRIEEVVCNYAYVNIANGICKFCSVQLRLKERFGVCADVEW